MSSLLVRGRSSTLGNRSASETDLSSKVRRRSVQSINHFSLRRKLGTEPIIHSLRSTSKNAASPTRPVERPSPPKIGGWRRTNRGDVLVPQPFSSCRRSHLDPQNLPAPAIIIFHAPDASDMSASPSPPPPPPLPPLHHHHQDPASKNTVENFTDSLPLRLPLASILEPLFTTGPLQLPQTMGNRLSNRLQHDGRSKENEIPQVKPDSAKSTMRPASSPAPARFIHPPVLPFPVVIPDRRSSITPQPHPRYTPGNVSLARTVRPRDIMVLHPPLRSATAPGTTKPVSEKYLAPLPPSHAVELSASSPSPTTETASPSPSPSPSSTPYPHPSNPPPPQTPKSSSTFPLLTLNLPIRPPPLTMAHFACYQSHRRVSFSPNVHNPMPCMTCEVEGGKARWKCQWCCLRLCTGCMERLAGIEGRDLERLLKRLGGEGRGFLAGGEEWGGGNWNGDGKGVGRLWDYGVGDGDGRLGVMMERKEEGEAGGDGSFATSVVARTVVQGHGKENRGYDRDRDRGERGGTIGGPGLERRGLGMDWRKVHRRAHGHGRGYENGQRYGEHGHGHRHSHGHGHGHGHRHTSRSASGHGHGHGNGQSHRQRHSHGHGYERGYGLGLGHGYARLYDGHGWGGP